MKQQSNGQSSFGARLKQWRRRQGLSQLELSCRSEVGQRHLSFIESGRSRPGEDVVCRLARALALPLREQNSLLLAAGFAAPWPETRLDASVTAPFRYMIEEMLTRQMPYPAYAMDRHWNVVMANPAATKIWGAISLAEGGTNLVEMMLENDHTKNTILNLDEVLAVIADEIEKDLARFSTDPLLFSLHERLIKRAAPAPLGPSVENRPVVTVNMQIDGTRLNTISTIARFFGPLEICLDELRVELVYPADDASRAFFQSLSYP